MIAERWGLNDYSLLIALGFGLGLWQVYRSVPRERLAWWLNACLVALFFALVGARAGYTFQHAAYFGAHPWETPQLWLGGLSWPGAVLGGLVALALIAAVYHLPMGMLADRLALLIPPIAIAACLGSWMAGAAYGPLAPQGAWWAVVTPDETGALAARWPLQPVAAFTLLGSFALIEWKFKKKSPPGFLALMIVLALALNLLLFSLLTAEPGPSLRGYRLETWSAGALLLLALAALAFTSRRRKTNDEGQTKGLSEFGMANDE